jgi:hypothetical protein
MIFPISTSQVARITGEPPVSGSGSFQCTEKLRNCIHAQSCTPSVYINSFQFKFRIAGLDVTSFASSIVKDTKYDRVRIFCNMCLSHITQNSNIDTITKLLKIFLQFLSQLYPVRDTTAN